MKRLSLHLLISLMTFFLGILLPAVLMLSFNSIPEVPDNEFVVITECYCLPAENTEFDKQDIKVEYRWSLIGVDSLDGVFVVTNNSRETIYYSGYENALNQENKYSCIKQNGKTKSLKSGSPELMKEQSIKPNESVTFWLPTPQNERPFEAGFDFFIGKERKEQTVWIKVKKQLKSYGLTATIQS